MSIVCVPLMAIFSASPGLTTVTSTLLGSPGDCGVSTTRSSGASAASEMRMRPCGSAVALRQSPSCARLQTVTTSPPCSATGAMGTIAS